MLLDDITAASRAKRILVDPFSYVIDFNTLAASAVNQAGQFAVNADSDFVLRYSMIVSMSAVGVEITRPDYLFTMNDTGSGRSLENTGDHVLNGFGTAQWPYVWSEPKLFTASSTLTVQLTNLTAVAARVVLTFGGFKVFYMRGYNRDNAFFLS